MMEVKQAFELCDTKKDGKIDRHELKAYFSNIGIPLSEREVDNMMRVADNDRSGFVELDEFINIMSRSLVLICTLVIFGLFVNPLFSFLFGFL